MFFCTSPIVYNENPFTCLLRHDDMQTVTWIAYHALASYSYQPVLVKDQFKRFLLNYIKTPF